MNAYIVSQVWKELGHTSAHHAGYCVEHGVPLPGGGQTYYVIYNPQMTINNRGELNAKSRRDYEMDFLSTEIAASNSLWAKEIALDMRVTNSTYWKMQWRKDRKTHSEKLMEEIKKTVSS